MPGFDGPATENADVVHCSIKRAENETLKKQDSLQYYSKVLGLQDFDREDESNSAKPWVKFKLRRLYNNPHRLTPGTRLTLDYMSTERATFPWRRPVEQPPPLLGVIENGRPTPSYVLAWVCDSTTFFKNLGGGELGKVDYCNFSDVVSNNWRTRPKFGFGLRPLPYPGPGGNFYLIIMFNETDANHIARIRNLTEDPLIESARVAMGVDQDKSLEKTLQWLRWPLNWLAAEHQQERALLAQQESDSDNTETEGSEESADNSEESEENSAPTIMSTAQQETDSGSSESEGDAGSEEDSAPTIISAKLAAFSWRRPVEQPPPIFGVIENGCPTPKYVLAWVCDPPTFFKNLGAGKPGKVHDGNFTDAVSNNWRTGPKFGFGLKPIPYPGPDGKFYLIVMFNYSDSNHIARIRNITQDPLIESARVAMGVDQDKSLEKTLQWFRWPLNWLAAERQQEMALLAQQESGSDSSDSEGSSEASEEDSAPTTTSTAQQESDSDSGESEGSDESEEASAPTTISTKPTTFSWRRPVEQPPPLLGVIENGRPTPRYALAWVCDTTTFFKNLGGGELGKVHDCNFSDVVSANWTTQEFGFGLHPIPYPGTDGNFYLIVMFNDSEANHIARVRNLTEDPLIASARVAMGVDQDKSLEKTLQWLRWPLNWLQAEERLRRMALLPQQPEESDSDSSEGKGSDEPELEDSE